MPNTYNGVAGHVALATAVSISEPVDADAPNSASVNTPLEKLADYAELLRQNALAPTVAWNQIGNDGGATAFQNSWNVSGLASGLEVASYFKDPAGFVHLAGLVNFGTNGATMFTLPAGYRPTEASISPVGLTVLATGTYFPSGFGTVNIKHDGTVTPQAGGTGGSIDLTGINFHTAVPLKP